MWLERSRPNFTCPESAAGRRTSEAAQKIAVPEYWQDFLVGGKAAKDPEEWSLGHTNKSILQKLQVRSTLVNICPWGVEPGPYQQIHPSETLG